ncbi:receptor-transporting protein 4-like [Bufo bufo]|uniref:receptor-transporting protein 4-like n=1 Tax=Bufo bufo TaxID=8384 RepID=UPI001ABE9598|nr:receptor-transporting protein 4-like [Bufo bufo]XP_040284333.1 receptor-transporting protein 4-like [Bufo bufo]
MNSITWYEEFDNEIDEAEVPGRWNLVVDEDLLKQANARYFDQKTFGSFCCLRCNRTWFSSKVFILFRMKRGEVTMRIFKQECQKCKRPKMQEPSISDENVKIVISNVVNHIQRVFYGEERVNDDRPPNIHNKLDGPHDEAHCEACKYNLCDRQTKGANASSMAVGRSVVQPTAISPSPYTGTLCVANRASVFNGESEESLYQTPLTVEKYNSRYPSPPRCYESEEFPTHSRLSTGSRRQDSHVYDEDHESTQETTSSRWLPALAVGVGALALLAFSMHKTKENKRGGF